MSYDYPHELVDDTGYVPYAQAERWYGPYDAKQTDNAKQTGQYNLALAMVPYVPAERRYRLFDAKRAGR